MIDLLDDSEGLRQLPQGGLEMAKFEQELPHLQAAIEQIRDNPESVDKLLRMMDAEIDRRQDLKDRPA